MVLSNTLELLTAYWRVRDRGPRKYTHGAPETDVPKCHFYRLPAELRNEIFRLTLVEEDEDIDIDERWPGITGACKQYRDEALAIYLGNNTFTACITDLDDSSIVSWLSKIEGIEARYKSSIETLWIFTEGQLVDVEKQCRSTGTESCTPNYDFWDNIVARIVAAGLKATQVGWPSSLIEELDTETAATAVHQSVPIQLVMQSVILFHDVLPILLQRYDLYDPRNPYPDIVKYIRDNFGTGPLVRIDQYLHQNARLRDFPPHYMRASCRSLGTNRAMHVWQQTMQWMAERRQQERRRREMEELKERLEEERVVRTLLALVRDE